MRKPSPKKISTCQGCHKEYQVGSSSMGLFCSNRCQRDRQWEDRKAEIERTGSFFSPGATTFPAVVVRRYLQEKHGDCCSVCRQSNVWHGKPLTMIIDHANGDPSDHAPANLRLVCPNCDAQAPTYRGRNRGRGRKSKGIWTDPSIRGRNRTTS